MTVTAAFAAGKTYDESKTVTVSVGGAGTAAAGTDYASVPDFDVTIAAGGTSGTATFTLTPTDDSVVEGDETVGVAGSASGLTVNAAADLTLTDNDGAPAVNLSVSPSSVGEGAGATTVTVTAAFAAGKTYDEAKTVTVSVGGGGTATAGTDYASVPDFDVTIAAGGTSGTATFTLTPTDDGVVEGDETIGVSGSASGLTVNAASDLTLTDDDDAPEVNLSLSPSTVGEGAGATDVTVAAAFSSGVTFTEDKTVAVSVGGGTAASGTDYAAVPDFEVTIAAGSADGAATFTLTPTADQVVEEPETIAVTGRAAGLTVNGTALTLTDDTALSLGVAPARAAEGGSLVFTVTLQPAALQAVTAEYATADGTAAADADYASASGELVFAAGETEKTVTVAVADDAVVEDEETLTLTVWLTDPPGASVSASGTIADDDMRTLTVAGADVSESAGEAIFTVTLSSAGSSPIGLRYATADGTATAGVDYVAASGPLVFPAGGTERTVSVQVLDDDLLESAETLLLAVSAESPQSTTRIAPLRGAEMGEGGSGLLLARATLAIRDDEVLEARGPETRRSLHLLARSVASEAVSAVGERFNAAGGSAAPAVALGASASGAAPGWAEGGLASGVSGGGYPGAPYAAGAPGRFGAVWNAPGGQPSDQPFAELGWLDNASFSVPVGPSDEGGGWQVWGRAGTVRSRLRTESGGTTRGDVFSSHVGVETRRGDSALFGVAVSHSVGLLGYTLEHPLVDGASAGEGDGRLTSLQPYAHWAPRRGLTVWGMGGGGRGMLTLNDALGTVETPLGMRLFAGGARQELRAGGGLALKGDAFHATVRSDEHVDLAASSGTAVRGRVLAEGSVDWSVSASSSLSPRIEAGLRWDGGTDVEGLGAEVGGGLAYVNRRLKLGLETQGRYLLAHQADGFEEWGAGFSLRMGPGVAGRGPWLAVNPEWGAAASRLHALWDPQGSPGLHGGMTDAPGGQPDRLAATAGYRLNDSASVSVEALHDAGRGGGGNLSARVMGNVSWGGADGAPARAARRPSGAAAAADAGSSVHGIDARPSAPGRGAAAVGSEAPKPSAGAAPAAVRRAGVADGVGAPVPPASPVRLDAVAVAPFRNLSPAPADDWLAGGMAETLTAAFLGLDGMSVVTRAAGAGPAPAAWSVDGEYRRRGVLLRIDARLVDTRSGAVVARSSAEGSAADIFDLQDRIAADLSAALENRGAMPAASRRPATAGPSASGRAAAVAEFRAARRAGGGDVRGRAGGRAVAVAEFRAARRAAAGRIDGLTGLGN